MKFRGNKKAGRGQKHAGTLTRRPDRMTSSLTAHISMLQYILQRKSVGGRSDGRRRRRREVKGNCRGLQRWEIENVPERVRKEREAKC